MTSTPPTRRQLDCVAVWVLHHSIQSSRSRSDALFDLRTGPDEDHRRVLLAPVAIPNKDAPQRLPVRPGPRPDAAVLQRRVVEGQPQPDHGLIRVRAQKSRVLVRRDRAAVQRRLEDVHRLGQHRPFVAEVPQQGSHLLRSSIPPEGVVPKVQRVARLVERLTISLLEELDAVRALKELPRPRLRGLLARVGPEDRGVGALRPVRVRLFSHRGLHGGNLGGAREVLDDCESVAAEVFDYCRVYCRIDGVQQQQQ